jgi:hypothetical protein
LNRQVSGLYAGDNFPAKPLIYSISGATKVIQIEDLFLSNFGSPSFSPGTSAATDAIYCDTVASSSFKNLTIRYFFHGSGIHLTASSPHTAYFNHIDNPFVLGKIGITLSGDPAHNQANSTTVSGGEIVGVASEGSQSGLVINGGCSQNFLFGTDIEGSFLGPAILLDGASSNVISARMELSQRAGVNQYYREVNGASENRMNNVLPRPVTPSSLGNGSTWPGIADTIENTVLYGAQRHYVIPISQAMTTIVAVRGLTADLVVTLPDPTKLPQGKTIRIIRDGLVDDTTHTLSIVTGPNNSVVTSREGASRRVLTLAAKNTSEFIVSNQDSTHACYVLEKQPDTLVSSPTKGFYYRGDSVESQIPSAGAPPGWVCVNDLETYLTIPGRVGDTRLAVQSASSSAAGDIVGIQHTDGSMEWSTLAAVNSETAITLSTPLAGGVGTHLINGMASIYIYRFKAMAKLAN